MPQRVIELLASWGVKFGSYHNIEVWRMVPLCLMWYIWKERNARNFEDCERLIIELKAIMFKSLYVWMVVYNSSLFSNFLEFMDLCVFFYKKKFFFKKPKAPLSIQKVYTKTTKTAHKKKPNKPART
jgi:hypothetical protein